MILYDLARLYYLKWWKVPHIARQTRRLRAKNDRLRREIRGVRGD